jgi:excisionase family DNA binding protein
VETSTVSINYLDSLSNPLVQEKAMSPATYSTGEAAKQIGVSRQTLQAWLVAGKVEGPKPIEVGGMTVRMWTAADVARVRKFKPRTRLKK